MGAGMLVSQLGGPDSLKAIEPFLYTLFFNPDIIDFSFARQGPRAGGTIGFLPAHVKCAARAVAQAGK
jgi:protoheme ferro-lyase